MDVKTGGATVRGVNALEGFHPLDPLGPGEMRAAAALLRKALGPEDLRFERLVLEEPDKETVRNWEPGQPVDRQVRFVVSRPGGIGVILGLLSLTEERILRQEELPDARPMIMLEEFMAIEDAVKANPEFIAACERRGVTDMALVCVDPWSAGNFGVPGEEGRRLSHTFAWVRNHERDNFYAHPIEGVNAVVDVDTLEVIRVDDHYADREPIPVPRAESNYEADLVGETRQGIKPLDVIQQDGPSFTLEGHLLRWQGWDVRIGFNAREGLTLHTLGYTQNGVRRPILYRASLAEMVVPYGTPAPGHHRKNVFDIGEYGLGKLANSLTLGCDCLGAIRYLDAYVNAIDGEPIRIGNAICIHEEDNGIAWKHWDFRTDHTEVRRLRRLVISSISTVGNYEYASYWYLYQTGMIEFEMKATGIINTVACEPGKPSKYANEVAPGVAGQIHQHLFCARLDMEVDGPENAVMEYNVAVDPPGPDNPHGNAFYEVGSLLETEQGARRRINPETMRYWKVVNRGQKNAVGKPTAFKLEATHAVTPFTHPDSPSGQRGGFIQNHLWVTPFDPEQRYPAGEFVNHSPGGQGLPAWTQADRSIVDTDLVLWHVFGLHHSVRPEDYPVQPCVSSGFRFMPSGFFHRNPAIDLPPGKNAASCCV
ncbi:MAG: primary-amine oxidase [Ectothiorhodospiraceae bacterium]|nr:primary-amine oxidase [Ectothiorhodospiraceae bacterium]